MTVRLRNLEHNQSVSVLLLTSGLEAEVFYLHDREGPDGFPQPNKILKTLQDDFGNVVVMFDNDGTTEILVVQSIDLDFDETDGGKKYMSKGPFERIERLEERLRYHGQSSCFECGSLARWKDCAECAPAECFVIACTECDWNSNDHEKVEKREGKK